MRIICFNQGIIMEPLVNIATNAARRAGEIIIRNFTNNESLSMTAKQKNDFVTEVDVKAEQAIISTIHKAHPNHAIMAEESGYKEGQEDVLWIIDPLDGTTNYIHGFPHFAVSIAVQINKKIEHAVVFDPMRNEFFSASRGRGARLNDHRLRVARQHQLSNALLGTGFPFRNQEIAEKYFATFQSLFGQCSGIRRAGAATLDLAYVAAGRLDGFWEFSLQPWDIAAGSLLIKEAGGLVGDFDGGEQYLKSGNIVAGNPKIFKSLLQQINTTGLLG